MEKALEKRHYLKHGMRKTRLYTTWTNIIMRCTNKKDNCYERYGGRGITICDEWRNDLTLFYDLAIANGYEDNLSIYRINQNGNYEPSNCRWADGKTQARNTRVLRKDNLSGFMGVGFNKNAKKYPSYTCLSICIVLGISIVLVCFQYCFP